MLHHSKRIKSRPDTRTVIIVNDIKGARFLVATLPVGEVNG